MKLALALAVLLVAAAGVALVVAAHRAHDPLPERIASCVEDAGGRQVRGREGLVAARVDLVAGRRVPVAKRYALGRDRGLLMRAPGYAVLIVRAPSNPPLGRDPLRTLYDDPSRFAYVGVERTPVDGVLDGCARLVGGS